MKRNSKLIIGLVVICGLAALILLGLTRTNVNIEEKPIEDSSVGLLYIENSPNDGYILYKSDLSGKNKQIIEKWKYHNNGSNYKISPDGRKVARIVSGKSIEVADSSDLSEFKEIYSTKKYGFGIWHLVWSIDGKQIAFSEIKSEDIKSVPDEENIYTMQAEGTGVKLVKKIFLGNPIFLIAFNSIKNELYWMDAAGGGGVRNFTVASAIDGSIKEIKTKFNPSIFSELVFIKNLEKAYFTRFEDRTLVEYNLSDNRERNLYSGNVYVKSLWEKGNKIFIIEYFDNNTNKLIILDINTKKASDSLNFLIKSDLYPVFFSSDDKYLLLSKNEDKNIGYYIMDVKDNSIHKFKKFDISENATFLGFVMK